MESLYFVEFKCHSVQVVDLQIYLGSLRKEKGSELGGIYYNPWGWHLGLQAPVFLPLWPSKGMCQL